MPIYQCNIPLLAMFLMFFASGGSIFVRNPTSGDGFAEAETVDCEKKFESYSRGLQGLWVWRGK